MPGTHDTPETIIGVKLASAGISETTREVEQHAGAWDKLGQAATRVESSLGRVARGLGGLAGAAGVGALVNDFVRLETQANRTALAVGRVGGGRGGYDATRHALQSAAIATGQNPLALGAGIEGTASYIGSGGLGSPRAQQSFAQLLGTYGGAYSIDPAQLGNIVGSLLQSQGGQPASAAAPLLAQLASQAARGGMEGQTGAYLRTIQGLASSYVAQQPTQAGAGLAASIGEQYSAAANANGAYRNNPAALTGGLQSVTGGLQNAYGNPRLQALLQMGGIGYWEQRAGVIGHPDTAAKVKRLYDSMYGGGYHNTAEDLALRSAFGIQGADYIETGGVPDAAKLHHGGYGHVAPTTQQRLQQYLHTPQAKINIGRQRAERNIFDTFGGAFDDVLGFMSNNPLVAGALGLGAFSVGTRTLRWGFGRARDRIRGSRTQAEAEAGDARGAALAEEGAASDISGVTARAAPRATRAAESRLPALLGRALPRLGRFLGPAGVIASEAPAAVNVVQHAAHGDALGALRGLRGLNPADPWEAVQTAGGALGIKVPRLPDLGDVFGHQKVGIHGAGSLADAGFAAQIAAATGTPAPHTLAAVQAQTRASVKLPGDPTTEFARAVHEFSRAVRGFSGGGGHGGGPPGPNDIGQSLILSRALGRVAGGVAKALGGGGTGGGTANTAGLSGQQATIARAAAKYGIDPKFLWGIYGAETDHGHNVTTSSAGAVGPFQFMPATARELGINPYNFTSAAYGAARYLAQAKRGGAAGMAEHYNPGGGSTYYNQVLRGERGWGGHGGGPDDSGHTGRPIHIHVHTHINGTESARASKLVRGL